MYTIIQKPVLLLLLAFISVKAGAQAPGYMGKRFAAGYGMYVNPALAAYALGYGKGILDFTHEAFLEAAVAKKVSLGVSLRFYKTSYGNTRDVDVTTVNGITYGNIYQLDRNPTGRTSIRGRDFRLYAKFFKSNYVAPWGRYFLLGLVVNNYTVKYNPEDMYVRVEEGSYYSNNYRDRTFSDFGPETQKFHAADIMIGAGKSRVFANRLYVDYGYNLNLLAFFLTLADAPDDAVSFDNTTYADNYIKSTSAARIRGMNRFNVFVKVGFLF